MSDRAYSRKKGDPALKTYTGQVMEVLAPQLGKNPPHKERPRGVKISDTPGSYPGKLFRWWAWKDEQTALLQVGNWVTVWYEEEPGNNGYKGSNAISVVETAEPGAGSRGGEPQPVGGEVSSNAGETPAPSSGDWSSPPPESWATTKATMSKDDYWERKEATDQSRTLEIESAWAIKAVLSTSSGLTDEQVIDKALQLVILKRRLASELGRG